MANEIEILSLSTEELWNFFKKEADLTSEEFQCVRKGVRIPFDIIDYFQYFNIRIKEKQGKVIIGGKTYKKTDVDTELILRERIMSEFLLERFGNKHIASPRGIK